MASIIRSDMDFQQFMALVDSSRFDFKDTLPVSYERAERIHERLCLKRRFSDFESFEQRYYRENRKRRRHAVIAREQGKSIHKAAKAHSSERTD